MGVRGLTTFIANRSDTYLMKYELSNTYLVIDGNSICSQMYRLHSKCNDCFGGDYDKYAHSVYKFFEALKICNITPIVVFDGGYEKRKLKTVMDRMKTKLKSSYNLNSVTEGSYTVFPLFLREVFKDIVLRLEIKCVRCEFEADSATAWVAKTLDCPVLSYDSDFFIFDALYIPFPTLNINPHKVYNKQTKEFTYFLQCRSYKIDHFLESFGGMDKTNLPLLATLLGNDYMNRREFMAFYDQLKLHQGGQTSSEQQRRIKTVIMWLKNETFESAVTKILSRFKTQRRENLKIRLEQALQAYIYVDCDIFNILDINIKEPEVSLSPQLNNITLNDEGDDTSETESQDELYEIVEDIFEDDSNSGLSNLSDVSNDKYLDENETHKPSTRKLPEAVTIPETFKTKFKRCIIPPGFMDILTLNCYYFIPQVEDHKRNSSHAVSLPILSAIHRILRGSSSHRLVYYSRNDQCDVKKYYLETLKDELPNLCELDEISSEEARRIFLKILSINDSFIEKYVKSFPSNWHLILISLNYWVQNVQVEYAAIYSIILCVVILLYVDKQIGFCRSSKQFAIKYSNALQTFSNQNMNVESVNFSSDVNDAIEQISYKDSLFCMKKSISYFQMEFKARSNVKLYEKSIIHDLAEFQSVLLHMKYLNSLLNFPFVDFCISDFYDGTFIYNMTVNLRKRSNLDVYIGTFLSDSPSVLNLFETVIKTVIESHKDKGIVNSKPTKRRRKKRKSYSAPVERNNSNEGSSSNDDAVFDENNRFSLLSTCKS